MRVTIENGVSINIRSWGDRTPRALLIHGFGDNSFVWDGVASRIASQVPSMGLDLRGHGDSTWDPAHDYRTETHASDVGQLIERLRLRDLTLVGHSLGAAVAIRVANTLPDVVRNLALVDGGPDLDGDALDYIYDAFRAQPFHYESVQDYVNALAARTPLAERATLETFAGQALKRERSGGFALKCDPALRSACRRPSSELWPLLQSLACPVLVARGRGSAVLPQRVALRMTHVLQSGELVSIPAAGHAVMLDNAASVAAALLGFLARHDQSRDSRLLRTGSA
jgi:pimeloyl-ACP methyl ester carboxylesterase